MNPAYLMVCRNVKTLNYPFNPNDLFSCLPHDQRLLYALCFNFGYYHRIHIFRELPLSTLLMAARLVHRV